MIVHNEYSLTGRIVLLMFLLYRELVLTSSQGVDVSKYTKYTAFLAFGEFYIRQYTARHWS